MNFIVDPLDTDPEAFPCPGCKGNGTVWDWGRAKHCHECGGSGYGPPPTSLDRERSHCLQRLSAWAHRDCQKQEN